MSTTATTTTKTTAPTKERYIDWLIKNNRMELLVQVDTNGNPNFKTEEQDGVQWKLSDAVTVIPFGDTRSADDWRFDTTYSIKQSDFCTNRAYYIFSATLLQKQVDSANDKANRCDENGYLPKAAPSATASAAKAAQLIADTCIHNVCNLIKGNCQLDANFLTLLQCPPGSPNAVAVAQTLMAEGVVITPDLATTLGVSLG